MTTQQLESERQYRYEERLGLLCGTDKPNLSQMFMAQQESDEAVEKLKK